MELHWSPKRRKCKRYLLFVEKCQRSQKEEMGEHTCRGRNSAEEKKKKKKEDRYESLLKRTWRENVFLSVWLGRKWITSKENIGRWELRLQPWELLVASFGVAAAFEANLCTCCYLYSLRLWGPKEKAPLCHELWSLLQGFQQHMDM